MNVIQRICEKYPIEYNLMPDFRTRSVTLRFGTQVPTDLQEKISDGLEWLGVMVEDRGMPVSVDVSQIRADSYTLSANGKEYHFSDFIGIPLVGYDLSEAIIWTIYILAGNKPWLDPYQGKFISCRCFSARQQAAAVKGYRSPVAGDADILLVPSITAGNILGKALYGLAGGEMAGVVLGATVPITVNSRGATPAEKYDSILICAAMAAH